MRRSHDIDVGYLQGDKKGGISCLGASAALPDHLQKLLLLTPRYIHNIPVSHLDLATIPFDIATDVMDIDDIRMMRAEERRW